MNRLRQPCSRSNHASAFSRRRLRTAFAIHGTNDDSRPGGWPLCQLLSLNTYDGQFRWYSFAIHGTNDDSRVGQAVTGGCINVDKAVMAELLETVQLGDEVL